MELVMHQMIATIRNGQCHAAVLAASQPVKHQVVVTQEILRVQVQVQHQCQQVTKSQEVT
jgi:hypothetical protein